MTDSDADPGRDQQEPETFEAKQARELKEFEAQQRHELQTFEKREHEELEEFERREKQTYTIKIDRTEYRVHQSELTGEQIRNLPKPPIGPDRDLFEVVPGGSDRKVANDMEVKMRDGLRFFTAPAQINPGSN